MAAEGRRQGGGRGREGGGRGRGADAYSRDGPGSAYDDERSSGGYDREDRYRERDPYARREGAAPPPPPPLRERVDRPDVPPPAGSRDDPYYQDPYRRPADDPYRAPYRDDPYRRDPYRRDPYEDPYRDPYFRDPYLAPPPPKKPMPADVQVICMNKQLVPYAESIEARLRQSALIVDIVIIPEAMQVSEMVEDAARLKCLFAIIINTQNELHKSLTLNILHGTPQEHRNMPMEDAMKLVASSFEKYIQTQREKVAAPPAAPVAPTMPPFLPPPADVAYLLNLLADNRQLTLEELDKVIDYLRQRKDKLAGAEGVKSAGDGVGAPMAANLASPTNVESTSAFLQQQQQELQSKILNILNGSGSSGVSQGPPQPVQTQVSAGYRGVAPTGVGRGQAGASQNPNPLINFDNPNVKKALDSLIQSGPSLLKSLPSSVAPQSQFSVAAAGGAAQRQPAQQQQHQPGYPAQAQSQTTPSAAQYGGYGAQFQQQGQSQAPQRAPAPTGYGAAAQRPSLGARIPQQGRPRF